MEWNMMGSDVIECDRVGLDGSKYDRASEDGEIWCSGM